MPIIHVGKKAPKGFKELPGAMHLGGGIWTIPIQQMDSVKRISHKKVSVKQKRKDLTQ